MSSMPNVIIYLNRPFYAASSPWGWVFVGRYFKLLPKDEQDAILAHEEGHMVLSHTMTRLWWLVSFKWMNHEAWMAATRDQEFEADAYAAHHGHKLALERFLMRYVKHPTATPIHPSNLDRIVRLNITE